MRATSKFLLDAAIYFKSGGDLTDNLILLAIVQANVVPVMADPVLQRRYASAEAPPPGELRRPISINAIAASLQLPFETVRRRILQMAARQVCVITPRGLITSQRGLTSPAHLALLEANHQAVKELYIRLRRNGVLPAPAAHPQPEAPPIRAVARISSEFVLRLTEPLVGIAGNLIDGLTLIAVFDLNTAGFPDQVRHDRGADSYVADDQRTPATVRAVAGRLGLPYEQTRRRLAHLKAEGRCIRAGQGYIITAQTLARPDLMEAYRSSVLSLHRMFAALAELGALAPWEAELADGANG
jgi:DNA-binding Lrp family transcriptional regulator